MKKRIISLTLALLMILSMTACSSKPAANSPATNPPAADNTPVENPTEAPTGAPTEATEPANALALGVVDGQTYSNTYAGLGCTLDGDWVIYPADQLQELPSITQQMMEGTELEKAMENVTQFTDMYAESVELLCNMNLLFQKLDMTQRIAYAVMDEKAVLDATMEQKDVMIQAYANGGITVESMEIIKVTFLGEEHYALKTIAQTEGVPYYCLQVFDFWLGQYSMTLTFASFIEDNTESLLDLFYVVE